MRFLVCFVLSPEKTPSMQLKVYPLKYATSPDEVTYPIGTVCFTFAEAESIDSIYEGFILIKPSNAVEFGSVPLKQLKGSNLYLIGQKVTIKRKTFVQNSRTGVLLPFEEDGKTIVIPE